MKKLLFSLSFLLMVVNCFAQRLPRYLNNDTTKYQYAPLCVLKMPNYSPVVSFNQDILQEISPNNIDSLSIYKGDNSTKRYGQKARCGVIIINYKSDITFTLSDTNKLVNVLNKNYNIKLQETTLPVYIDSAYVTHPDYIYLEAKKIRSAKIETEAASGIKFINILTFVTQPLVGKNGEIMIRGTSSL